MNIRKPTWKVCKKKILNNFSFLQTDFEFPKFSKKWIKDEYNVSTKKGNIEFFATILEFDSSTPIIGIMNHGESIDFDHNMYPTNFYWIHNLDESGRLKMMTKNGQEFVEAYISECAELLKQKPKILNGISMVDFNKNHE